MASRSSPRARKRSRSPAESCARSTPARPRIFIVRAEAPFAAMLGLPAKLETLTQGNAVHAILLLRYAPLPPEPSPQAA